jgi:hypothetical protein
MSDPANRQNSNGSGGGNAGFRPRESVDVMAKCPSLRAYVERVGADHDIEVRNFRTIVLTDLTEGSRYRRDRAEIKIARDGAIKCPKGFEPTDAEAAAIKTEFSALILPSSVNATLVSSDDQRLALGIAKEDWFEMLNRSRTEIVMCQQRIEHENGKNYLPWSFWSDGKWRNMEPDGDGLPLWKPQKNRAKISLMIHEGAKAARYVDWLMSSDEVEAREMRAKHPWAADLAWYEHWGWIGGAPNPHRPDWSELASYTNLKEVVVVTDNDFEGKQAIRRIALALKSLRAQVWEVRFNDGFPENFDLAKPFPEKFWSKDRYRGPTLADCRRSATWATRVLSANTGKGGTAYTARQAFLTQWLVAIKPPVFVHRSDPGRLLDEGEFNAATQPFSDVKNTADLMRREPAIQVDGVAYEPGQNAGTITMDGRQLVNTWTPSRIARVKGDVTPFLAFMTHLIPVLKDRDHMLKWIATFVACPGLRMRHGILMISEQQGVGKGTLMEKILAPLAGWHNVSVPSEKMLTDSSFNSWLVMKRLILVHEIYAGQAKKAYDNIKSYVTDDNLRANEKTSRNTTSSATGRTISCPRIRRTRYDW